MIDVNVFKEHNDLNETEMNILKANVMVEASSNLVQAFILNDLYAIQKNLEDIGFVVEGMLKDFEQETETN